ncbi:GNAT family N-acetyltransferase [Lactobacillus corticis]|nr:GNAT family N-acetyltransferase [Lactobacillus corticis]
MRRMEFHFENNQLQLLYGEKIAGYIQLADLPKDEGKVILKTFVDQDFRGEGLAGDLMDQLLQLAEKNNWKLKSQCSYATHYFENHPEYENYLIY